MKKAVSVGIILGSLANITLSLVALQQQDLAEARMSQVVFHNNRTLAKLGLVCCGPDDPPPCPPLCK